MGEVLHKHREEIKKYGKWMEFCNKIGLHIAMANQQIRMYEISLENSRIDILKRTITNWTKVNLFLSLSEEDREEIIDLAEEGKIDADSTAIEFRDIICDIKQIDREDEVEKPEDIKFERNPLHEDSGFAADLIKNASGLSNASKPFLEAYSSIQR
jgi:hypothetical protein